MSLVGRSRHDLKKQAREELELGIWYEVLLFLLFLCPTVSTHVPVVTNWEVVNYPETALSIPVPAFLKVLHLFATPMLLTSFTRETFQISKTTTCHTVLYNRHARHGNATKLGLSWNRAGWMAFRVNPRTENRYESEQGLATQPSQDYWHTLLSSAFHTSLRDWVAASRSLPIVLLPPLEAWTVMPRPCHKDSTFRWEKLKKMHRS